MKSILSVKPVCEGDACGQVHNSLLGEKLAQMSELMEQVEATIEQHDDIGASLAAE